jgi:hypothetical protein
VTCVDQSLRPSEKKRVNVYLPSLMMKVPNLVYVLLGISPASICSLPTFRNHISVPSSKAGSRLCGVRKGKAIYTVARYGTAAGRANGKVRHR